MKHYTPKQVNLMKQEIRKGKPLPLIAKDLSREWNRPYQGIYSKVVVLSKKTYKINKTWEASERKAVVPDVKAPRPSIIQETLDFTPLLGSLIKTFSVKEEQVIEKVCNDIIETSTFEDSNKVFEIIKEPTEICIEVPTGNISFIGTPNRVVIYSDHVRYYYN
jgi:hypothetical protein